MPRIISLLPSATEIVSALGLEDDLVGRSHECDYPERVKNLPVCTEPKIDVQGSSLEIDQSVYQLVQKGLSVYRINCEELNRLKPDFIVTQAQCEVCAVSLKDVEEAVKTLVVSQPQIISLTPWTWGDILADINRVGDSLGVSARAHDLISQLKNRVDNLRLKIKSINYHPKVFCLEWLEPLMAAGSWIPELVEWAGGKNMVGEKGKLAPKISWEVLVRENPDFILLMPCGFDQERIRKEMHILTQKKEWSSLQAVRKKQVVITDGNQYFNRPGPRIADSVEILAEILHPEHFSFGFQGKGWQPFT